MQRIDPFGPYQLAGYSFGAGVVHEMFLQLHKKGLSVQRLIIFDGLPYFSVCKNTLDDSPVLSKSFFENLMLISEVLKEFLNQKELQLEINNEVLFTKSKEEQLDMVFDALVKHGFNFMTRTDFYTFVKIYIHQVKIWDTYIPDINVTHNTPVTLFRADKENEELTETYGWETVTRGGVIVHRIEGNHMNILSLPHVESITKTIKAVENVKMEAIL